MSDLSASQLSGLPANIPEPIDDGACDHLTLGRKLPSIQLKGSDGDAYDLSTLSGRAVVFVYPRTGVPEQELPPGWNDIPGARGCTPQSCRFRDLHGEFAQLGIRIFGLSSQDTEHQLEAATRLNLPYPLLSDSLLEFASALSLPTFTVSGMKLIKRLTLVIQDGSIERVFYPVFPPDVATDRLLARLRKG